MLADMVKRRSTEGIGGPVMMGKMVAEAAQALETARAAQTEADAAQTRAAARIGFSELREED